MADGAWQYEAKLKQLVSTQLRTQLADIHRSVAAYWLVQAGALDRPLPPAAQRQLREWLRIQVRLLRPDDLAPGLRSSMREGLQVGVLAAGGDPGLKVRVSRELNEAAGRIDSTIRDALVSVRHDLQYANLERYSDVTALLARVGVAANRAEATAVWAAHRAVNDGVAAVAADGVLQPVVWMPEVDACATCLAYAGQTVYPGELFPAGLTFGDSSTVKRPITGPPAHPFCRCELQLLPPGGGGPDDPYVVAALRMAQRAILDGKVSGSEPAKLRAADRLLRSAIPLLVPKTAIRRARERVAGR